MTAPATITAEEIKGSTRPRNAPFVSLYDATPDARGFFEAVLGFERMAGRWFRVDAATQRRFFGNVPFGKRSVKIDEGGKVTVFKSQAFGQDFDKWEIMYDHSAKGWVCASDGSPLSGLPASF